MIIAMAAVLDCLPFQGGYVEAFRVHKCQKQQHSNKATTSYVKVY